jgi:hypothetical protein
MSKRHQGLALSVPLFLVASAALIASDVAAQGNNAAGGDWEFSVGIYGWFPDLKGTTGFPTDDNGFEVPIDDIVDKLDFTLQGNFDARRGKWGLFTDLIYLDLGDQQTFTNENTVSDLEIPVDSSLGVGVDVKNLVWTTLGYYRIGDAEQATLDLAAGVRYVDMEQSLGWTVDGNIGELPLPGEQGSARVSQDFLDFVVGFRGRVNFGSNLQWFLPYYGDIGTGDSDLTWQGALGIGYAFGWGDVAAVYRHLDYDLPSSAAIQDLQMSGPAIGVAFHW